MLPEIVRAAAEPMGNIQQLTVLSNDGASDLVKNVTRTVTEANSTVYGLTGIDIPGMLNDALGGSGGGSDDEPPKPKRGGGGPGSGGSSGSGGSGGVTGSGGGARGSGGTSAASASASASTSTGDPSATSSASAAPPPPRFETSEAVDAAMQDAERAVRGATAATRGATTAPAARTDTAAGPATPAPSATRRPQVAEVTSETTVAEAATRLANDLRAVPGIERFGTLRLDTLDTSGPRPLRTMWRVAREELGATYGQMTIGEVIDRYGSGSSPNA